MRRWGDNDRHFGPLTLSLDKWRPFGICLSSDQGCHARAQLWGLTIFCELPRFFGAAKHWVDTSRWSGEGAGFWDYHTREYGFLVSDGHVTVKYGAQTHDSSTDQNWGFFLPWTQWRCVSHQIGGVEVQGISWEKRRDIEDGLARRAFLIEDFDGEKIEVGTRVERWVWRLGTGWFKWLGFIKQERVSLDLRFSKEMGPDKGSWKGGTVGHSIDMLPGESPADAMMRYCDMEHRARHGVNFKIKYLGGG